MKYMILTIAVWCVFAVPAIAAEGTFEDVTARALRDIHTSISLTPRQQEIVQLASLSAIGQSEAFAQLRHTTSKQSHLSPKDIALILTQLTSYYGFPKAKKAFDTLIPLDYRQLPLGLPEDDRAVRHEVGKREYTKLNTDGYDSILKAFGPLAENLPATTFPLFGDAYSPQGLTLQERQLATIAALTAMGTADPQLRFHIGTSLNVGLSQTEIMDMIVMTQFYAGMPAAYNGAIAAKAVFEKRALKPDGK